MARPSLDQLCNRMVSLFLAKKQTKMSPNNYFPLFEYTHLLHRFSNSVFSIYLEKDSTVISVFRTSQSSCFYDVLMKKCASHTTHHSVWKSPKKCLVWDCNFVKMRLFLVIFKPLWYTWQQGFNVSFLFSRLGNHHGLTGFPGLFLAALTAQSLSLVSTGYNKILTNLWNLLKVVRTNILW